MLQKKGNIVFIIVLIAVAVISIILYTVNNKKNEFQINEVNVKVYADYPLEDIQSEIETGLTDESFNSEYTILSAGKNVLTKEMGPFFKFWVNITLEESQQNNNSDISRFICLDYGEYVDHWIYLQNPFGGNSQGCALGFYKGDLSDEQVKEALYSVKLIYTYKDSEGKNCDSPVIINQDVPFSYPDF